MALNNDNLLFSSSWDIDQILLPEPITTTVFVGASSSPNTTPATSTGQYVHNLGYLPNIEATYQAPGQTIWHQCNLPDGYFLAHYNTYVGSFNYFYPGLVSTNGVSVAYGFDTSSVFFNVLNYSGTAMNVNIRIYFWGDKIDY